MENTVKVVDISHWNPTPDWDALKAGGVVGVIHKATEGTSYVDDQLFKRAGAAMKEGLCWSTYHFLKPGAIEDQMAHYLNTVNPVSGERVCIDHESDGVSLQDLKNAVAYIRQRRPDLKVAIYSGHLIKEQLGDSRDEYLRANTDLWIAHFTSAAAPTWPRNTWDRWTLWQWTDSETVPGISAPVDGDRFNGDPADIPAWFGVAGEAVPPEPGPEPQSEVLVRITAPAAVSVRVVVNGVPAG